MTKFILGAMPYPKYFTRFTSLFSVLLLSLVLTLSFSNNAIAAPGDLDTALGSGNGYTTQSITGSSSSALRSTTLSNGDTIVAGQYGSPTYAGVSKIGYSGSLDTSFGTSGIAKDSTWGSYFSSVVTVPNVSGDKMVVVGKNSSGSTKFAQLNNDGSVDTGFGGGMRTLSSSDFGGANLAYDPYVFRGSDGKIYVCGSNGSTYAVIRRYNSDGSVDTGYGTSGL